MRKLNCRPGDLAIVVEAFNPVNIGNIVNVLSKHRDQMALVCPEDDVIWLVQAAHPMTYEKRGKITRRKKGAVPDSQLRPIRGYPLGKDIAVGVIEAHAKKEGKLREFVVDEYGTISDPVSFEPTNAEVFDLEDYQSIDTLIETVELCPPLLNHFHQLAWEKKNELAASGSNLLEALSDEDFGWRNWITAEGEAGLGWFVGQVEAWLDEPASDDEQTAQQCSGVALAKRYFECLGNKTMDALGVQIIDGEHPGSTYYAAELRQDIDYANEVARDSGLECRFVRG